MRLPRGDESAVGKNSRDNRSRFLPPSLIQGKVGLRRGPGRTPWSSGWSSAIALALERSLDRLLKMSTSESLLTEPNSQNITNTPVPTGVEKLEAIHDIE